VSDSKRSSSIGFAGLLTLLFIGLKLGGAITWSWWWILSPLWINFLLVIAIIGVVAMIAGIGSVLDYRKAKANQETRLARLQQPIKPPPITPPGPIARSDSRIERKL